MGRYQGGPGGLLVVSYCVIDEATKDTEPGAGIFQPRIKTNQRKKKYQTGGEANDIYPVQTTLYMPDAGVISGRRRA